MKPMLEGLRWLAIAIVVLFGIGLLSEAAYVAYSRSWSEFYDPSGVGK